MIIMLESLLYVCYIDKSNNIGRLHAYMSQSSVLVPETIVLKLRVCYEILNCNT